MTSHNQNLTRVLERLRKTNLKLNPLKCEFLRKDIMYLGHKITSKGVEPDPAKVDSLNKYPRPTNTDEVKRFVAFANYYRRFIPNFANIAYPLNQLSKKNALFDWTSECETAFLKLKQVLASPRVLDYPDFSENNTFVLHTDASKVGLGAILSNSTDSTGKVIAYASRNLKPAETLPTSGHAENRMLNNIKRYYFWSRMSHDVYEYVKKCAHCQYNKHTNKYIKEPMTITTTPNTSFERISLDVLGPLEVDNYSYKYVLTIQCELSKFVEAYPLERKDTESVFL